MNRAIDKHFHYEYGLNGLYVPSTVTVHDNVEDAVEELKDAIDRYLDYIAEHEDDESVNMTEGETYGEERAYLEKAHKEVSDTTEVAKNGAAVNFRGTYDLARVYECNDSTCLDGDYADY